MKKHVLLPLFAAIGLVSTVLLVRSVVVPADFGVHGQREDHKNFTFGYYRLGAIADWEAFKAKYRGKEYCAECHEEKAQENLASKHGIIQCENCHGPAVDHPENPEKLAIDRDRGLCLRCHSFLDYPNSARGRLKGIDAEEHNPGEKCVDCHNPHKPNLEDM